MKLLTIGNLLPLVLVSYIVLHLPAIITLAIGLGIRNKKPERAKKLLIFSAVYFIIGGGICGSLLI